MSDAVQSLSKEIPKLLPCPFCGSPARDDLLPHAGGPGWVQCSSCECDQHMSDTMEDAVARWNTRASTQSAPDFKAAQKSAESDPAVTPDCSGAGTVAQRQPEPFNEALRTFFSWAMRNGPWDGCGLDGSDLQDKAEHLGLIVKTKFDPDRHQGHSEFRPGDDFYEFAPGLMLSSTTLGGAAK